MEKRIAFMAIAAALVLPWIVPALSFSTSLALALIASIVVCVGFYRAGWLGSKWRIERFVWQADGRWFLSFANGQKIEATLGTDTRTGPGVLWLRWNVNGKIHSMFLTSQDLHDGQLRRLLVRLRVDRSQPPDLESLTFNP